MIFILKKKKKNANSRERRISSSSNDPSSLFRKILFLYMIFKGGGACRVTCHDMAKKRHAAPSITGHVFSYYT